jgi:hypothetical protein
MKITNWKDCIRNQPKWKEFVEKAKTSLKKKKNVIYEINLIIQPKILNNSYITTKCQNV